MSILNRPYAGTWAPNRRTVVQWTPDFLVYLNGDTALPGCRLCHHNINIQEFVNSISCDFGVEPGASNCSIGMAVPRHYGDSIFRDGNTLLRPGLEVHVYFRGYFPMRGMTTPNSRPVAGINLEDIPQYPYYPVFHGVVTSVTHEYSSGFYTANLTCNGMLHFWEHMKMSGASGGSFFGARPANSGIQTTLTGHPMTGKTPYSIIYSLYRDTAGVADGVGFALSSRTNYGAVNSTTNDPLYAMTLRYWEQRFRGKIYGLRMHGASGQLFTSSQQAYLSLYRTNSFGGHAGTANVSPSTRHPSDDWLAQDPTLILGLRARGADGRILRQPDTRLAGAVSNSGRMGLDIAQLQAFPTDIGSYGQVNLWESTYESKMDIATAVTNVCGYEFYQDADGDLVFKPPLYNLDTSSSRVYRIEPEDIVSINFTESEPAATYVIVKGGAFQNTRGLVDESEWGCRSTYVDYKLVAQFGWIEASVESTYYTNPKSAFFFAINHLDRTNAGMYGCSVTIPLRPEIRPGYPVYIPHIDCFYYVTSVSHAFNLGAECTTTLTLTCRRRKFLPPGNPDVRGVALDQNLSQIDFTRTDGPIRVLQTLDNSGVPRIVGFPNVVMAIDPTTINPMFQVIGFQAVERELTLLSSSNQNNRRQAEEERNTRRQNFVWQFIQMMLTRNPPVLTPVNQNTSGNAMVPPATIDFIARNSEQQYAVAGVPGATGGSVTLRVRDIEAALTQYINNRATLKQARALLVRQLVSVQNDINSARAQAQRSGNDPSSMDISQFTQRAETIEQQIHQFDRNFDATPSDNTIQGYVTQYNALAAVVREVNRLVPRSRLRMDPLERGTRNTEGSSVILMSFLIGQFRTGGAQTNDVRTDPSGTINSSANLLEMLSDRKASLNLTVPGHYRYYSASHPSPDMQGYEDVSREVTENSSESGDTTPITQRSIREISRAGGTLVGPSQFTPKQHTRMTTREAAMYLTNAWRRVIGTSPPRAAIEILVAQWSHETGSGRSMMNYNFGGLKFGGAGLYTTYASHETVNGQVVPTTGDRFQAYASAESGAAHFVAFITDHRHLPAIQAYIANPGNAQVYADLLKRAGYFTSAAEHYGQDLQRRVNGIRRSGVLNNIPGIEPPASNPTDRLPRPTAAAEDEGQVTSTFVVRPMADEEDVPPERRGQYVELVPKHIPQKGLRVRVMDDSNTRVMPTNLIYAMTFESRSIPRVTNTTVRHSNPLQPRGVASFINQCLANGAQGAFANNLTDTFMQRVGSSETTTTRTTSEQVQALITLAVAGITGLRNREGLIGSGDQLQRQAQAQETLAMFGMPPSSTSILNITNGTPNNYDPTNTTSIRTADASRVVLQGKAEALIREVSVANWTDLRNAQRQLEGLAPRQTTLPPAINDLLTPWMESLTALFHGSPMPQTGPFQTQQAVRHIESSTPQFSPVFPVSDALGYEHYGSFQYGRGLSIEPGGNYERLMSADPLQYATDIQRERFLRALRSNPNDPQARAAAVREALISIANDPAFVNGPGAQIALSYQENNQRNSDRTTMIANGLSNYIMSDRDSVMKLPVNNVAYRLADLTPMGQDDHCGCRGAEADLLLAAYMAGTQHFAAVETEDEAMNWVAGQMEQATQAWSDAQSQMRGMSMERGRRSLLDSVEGWNRIADQYRGATQTATNQFNSVGSQADVLGNETQALFNRPLVPNRGQ